MNEAPSRDPSDWKQSTHLLQRVRERENPPIPGWVLKMLIEDGDYYTTGDNPHFCIITQVAGELHQYQLYVDPESMTAKSCMCRCHADDKDDCNQGILRSKHDP